MASNNVDKPLSPEEIEVTIDPLQGAIDVETDADVLALGVLPDGSMVIELGDAAAEDAEPDTGFFANLLPGMPEAERNELVTTVLDFAIQSQRAREDWEQTYKNGLELLGLKYEERTEPWAGACGVYHPMITEAVVRFQSETIMETFPASGPVLTKVLGKETREKMHAALRVRADMNYQLTERMVEFRDEHETMLFNLPAVGCAFKKVYRDERLKRPVSMFVAAEDVLLPYGSTNARSAPHVIHVMRRDKHYIQALQKAGFYAQCELGDPMRESNEIAQAKDKQVGQDDINDDRYTIYEALIEVDVTTDDQNTSGLPAQYVVTVLRDNQQPLAVRRNWREGELPNVREQHFVQYNYVPGFGPYGLGLFHLIGGYAKAGTSLLRQLIDAGTLSNLPGGLKARGMRVKGDDEPIRPGEFRDVDVGGGSLRDNILPLPYKEPSVVLSALLDKLIDEGRRLPGMADLKVADMSSQAPVGTVLALLERQLKVMSAVQARTHASLKEELKIIKSLVQEYEDDTPYDYEPVSGEQASRAADYAMVEVIPVSDPSAATMTQRLVQYQAVIQLSQSAPQIYNLPLLHRGMLEVLGIKDADKLVPMEDDIVPMDPVSENMRVLMGEPIKAFAHQDHASHIAVHMAAMQDPLMMQTIGQNPQAQGMMAAAMAHIAEHAAWAYRQQIEQQLGVKLPPLNEPLPVEVEVAMSQLMARAGQRLQAQHVQEAQAAQAQQQAQDPVLQLQMREQDRKERETAIKEKLADAKIAGEADKIAMLERELAANLAEKADKLRLAESKQSGDQELREQELQTRAVQVGMMGRAQDQAVLQKDREIALQLLQTLQQQHATNELGESGDVR